MANIRNINTGKNPGQQPPQPQGVDIRYNDTTPITCQAEGCECETFMEVRRLRYLSQLHPSNPTKMNQIIPYQTYVCSDCGTEMTFEEKQ